MSSSIADLESRLADVERRLAVLEGKTDEAPEKDLESARPTIGGGFAANASTHIGRVLLIFGGAYLLRAITDFGFVPTAIGLLAGAVYAVFWLYMAFRRSRIESERASAAFFGGTSVLLALPLLHESATRFGLLSGVEEIIALAVYCGLALAVAATRELRTLAWLVLAGGIVTAIASLVALHNAVPVATFLLLLGLGSLWIVYIREWMGLRWLGAIGADIGVVALVALSHSDRWPIESQLPFVFAVALQLSYLLSFTYHTHLRGKLVGLFETVQALVTGAIVLGAAVSAVQGGYLGMETAGVLGLALGVGGYGLAIVRNMRTTLYGNFFYYSTFGLVFMLAGTALLLPMNWAALIWAGLAMMMAWFSGRMNWVSLSLQCTFLILAAGAASGLLAAGMEALAGNPSNGWVALSPTHISVAAATVACLFIPVAQHSERWGSLAGLPQLIVLTLSVWGVGGIVIAVGAQLFAGATGPAPNLAVLAAIRTAVLAAAAVTLALSSRHWRWPEAHWLVYPVLVVTGVKLFVEDFPNGQPATLFVALACVGTALLLAARFLRSESSA